MRPQVNTFAIIFGCIFILFYIKLYGSWCLVESVLLYVKCTTHTDAVAAAARIADVATRCITDVAAAAVPTTAAAPVVAGP